MVTTRWRWETGTADALAHAYAGAWLVTDEAVRMRAGTGAGVGSGPTERISTNPTPLLAVQVTTGPLAAGPVAGTFRIVFTASNPQSSSARARVVVRLIADNGTVRGTLLDATATTTVTGGTSAYLQAIEGLLIPATAAAGDRLVVEYGANMGNTTTLSRSLNFQAWTAEAVDMPFTQDVIAPNNARPWFEIEYPETPEPPESLTATPTPTSVTLTWAPPAAGVAPTGYTVALDGAAPVDVGDVLTYSFTGLEPETAHTVQVWAYAAGGSSAPASVDFTTLPVPFGYYRATVEIGDHSWTAEHGDPPELGVALPLSFGWAMNDDATGYPAQLEITTASLLLVITDGAEIAGVDVGTWMRVRVWDNPDPGARPVGTFTGRVADYEIEPHAHGIAVRLLGADYTADLAGGGTVGGEPWPAESGDARAARIMAEHGTGWTSDTIGNLLEDRTAQPAPAGNVLRDTLTAAARYTAGTYTAPGRVILTPNVNAAGQLEPAAFRGTFVPAESVAIDKVPTAVHRRTTWRRNRITDGRWVHIDHPGGPTVYGDQRGTPRPRLAAPVYDTAAFADLALAVTPGFSWLSGAPLRLDLSHPDAPTAAVADWLWRDPASPPVPGAGRVVVVAVTDAMPGMFTRYAGMLAAVQFTLEPGGRRYIDFRLRPDVPAYSTVTPRWMDEPPAATWADELPASDWYALRTLDRSDYLEHLTP
jgi:hypothetical protein